MSVCGDAPGDSGNKLMSVSFANQRRLGSSACPHDSDGVNRTMCVVPPPVTKYRCGTANSSPETLTTALGWTICHKVPILPITSSNAAKVIALATIPNNMHLNTLLGYLFTVISFLIAKPLARRADHPRFFRRYFTPETRSSSARAGFCFSEHASDHYSYHGVFGITFSMRWSLKRYHESRQLHFATSRCFRPFNSGAKVLVKTALLLNISLALRDAATFYKNRLESACDNWGFPDDERKKGL